MKFFTKSATGDAGVFLLGYKINRDFKWPFRIMSADIGIDAETEIHDPVTKHSKGIFIKIQVKSTNKKLKNKFSFPITDEHFNYWQQSITPVMFCVVELPTQTIYYKNISCLDDVERASTKLNIRFDKQKDELRADSSGDLIKLYQFQLQRPMDRLMQLTLLLEGQTPTYSDDEGLNAAIEESRELLSEIIELETFADKSKWKFGKAGMEWLSDIKSTCNQRLNDLNRQRMEGSHY